MQIDLSIWSYYTHYLYFTSFPLEKRFRLNYLWYFYTSEDIRYVYAPLNLVISSILSFIRHIALSIWHLSLIKYKIYHLYTFINTFYLTNNNTTDDGINVAATCERNIIIFSVISVRNVIARIFRNTPNTKLVTTRRCFILFYIRLSAFFFPNFQPIYMDARCRLAGIIPDTRRAFVVIYLWHHAQYV